MKIRYFSSILASVAIALSVSPAWSQTGEEPEIAIQCDTSAELPKTLASAGNGQTVPIFNWQESALPDYFNPAQLCQEVSQSLQDYTEAGGEIASFQVYAQDEGATTSFNVCVEELIGQCEEILFSLNNGETQADSEKVLDGILDDRLKMEKVVARTRGVQSYGYKLNFFDLLGF